MRGLAAKPNTKSSPPSAVQDPALRGSAQRCSRSPPPVGRPDGSGDRSGRFLLTCSCGDATPGPALSRSRVPGLRSERRGTKANFDESRWRDTLPTLETRQISVIQNANPGRDGAARPQYSALPEEKSPSRPSSQVPRNPRRTITGGLARAQSRVRGRTIFCLTLSIVRGENPAPSV